MGRVWEGAQGEMTAENTHLNPGDQNPQWPKAGVLRRPHSLRGVIPHPLQ